MLAGTLESGFDTAMYLSKARDIIRKIEKVIEIALTGYKKYGVKRLQ